MVDEGESITVSAVRPRSGPFVACFPEAPASNANVHQPSLPQFFPGFPRIPEVRTSRYMVVCTYNKPRTSTVCCLEPLVQRTSALVFRNCQEAPELDILCNGKKVPGIHFLEHMIQIACLEPPKQTHSLAQDTHSAFPKH